MSSVIEGIQLAHVYQKKHSKIAVTFFVNSQIQYLVQRTDNSQKTYTIHPTNYSLFDLYTSNSFDDENYFLLVNSSTKKIVRGGSGSGILLDNTDSAISSNATWIAIFKYVPAQKLFQKHIGGSWKFMCHNAQDDEVYFLYGNSINGNNYKIYPTTNQFSGTEPIFTPNTVTVTPAITEYPDNLLNNFSSPIYAGVTNVEPFAGTLQTPSNNLFWTATDSQSWVYIDLQTILEVGYINIQWDTYYAETFDVQISDNSFTWETILVKSNNITANNIIGISRATRFIKIQGISSISPLDGYRMTSLNVYGRNLKLQVSPLLPTTDDANFVSFDTILTRNVSTKTFTNASLLDFIFQYTDSDIYTSVFPTDQGSTYELKLLSLTTTASEITMALINSFPVDIPITVLLSLERRVVHVSIPPSVRENEINYTHNIEYLNLSQDQIFIVEPISRDNSSISVAIKGQTELSLYIKGHPWTSYFPLRLTIYTEPHTFNNALDSRLGVDSVSTYTINQTFDTPYVPQYADIRVITGDYNYVPVDATTYSFDLTQDTPVLIDVEIQDGDLVALDTSNENITFSTQISNSKLVPYVSSSVNKNDVKVTVTLYRRTQYENSIQLISTVHDYEFINKTPVTSSDPETLRNLEITTVNGATKIDIYGTAAANLEFTPVIWEDSIKTTALGLTELFKQNVSIKSEKGVFLSSAGDMYLGSTTVTAAKTILGGGIIAEFTVDTTNNTISTTTTTVPDDTSFGTFIVTHGSTELGNYITFNVNITSDTPKTLTVITDSLTVIGYTDTTVNIHKHIPSLSTKTIQVKKFVGLPNSSITVNSASASEEPTDLNANDVNITGLVQAGSVTVNSIKTRNLLKNDNLIISANSDSVTISSKSITMGSQLKLLSDEIRLSLDKTYTIVDTDGNSVVVSKEVFLDTNSNNINISKIKDSTIPSTITLDTTDNVKNVYQFKDSGDVLLIGTLTIINKANNDTQYITKVIPTPTVVSDQIFLNKTYKFDYKIANFGIKTGLVETSSVEVTNKLTKTFVNSDKTKQLVETYLISVDDNISSDEIQLRSGLSYNPGSPLDSVETHYTYNLASTVESVYRKASSTSLGYNREYKIKINGFTETHVKFSVNADPQNKINMTVTDQHSKGKIVLHNTSIGKALIDEQDNQIVPRIQTDGEIEIQGNAPSYRTRSIEYTVFEDGTFFESSEPSAGLKTVHGTYVKTSEDSVTTTFSRNKLSSTYQDPKEYDSFVLDVGIVDLTTEAEFTFTAVNNVITKSNFPVLNIIPGIYTKNETTLDRTANTYTLTAPDGEHSLNVNRTASIKPHGLHDEYSPPQLSSVALSATIHTETDLHTPQNIYDIRYIGPESILDFYCEGVWYPQLKISDNTYLDTHITYINGTPKQTTGILQLAVNPFENKKSIETYSLSLLAKDKTLALENAGVSLANAVSSVLDAERKLPIENTSSLSWIKSKSTNAIDYALLFKTMLAYTTLFNPGTDFESVISTLKTDTPEATVLRQALFAVSPIDVQFNKYIVGETQQHTITDENWSKGLQVVGDRYISRIKKAIMDYNNIETYDIYQMLTGTPDLDTPTSTTFNTNSITPRYNFETSRVLSLGALVKQTPNTPKPGRWIKTGNVVWISADISIPTSLSSTDYPYTVAGNPFEKVIRGVDVPKIPNLVYNEDGLLVPPETLEYIKPSMVPDYTLDTSESPLPESNITRVNTNGTIGINNDPTYKTLTHNRHKFCGTFNIVELYPDLPDNDYTIPQQADLSGYGYTLDDSGNETFAGYNLKGSSALFNDGIYLLL